MEILKSCARVYALSSKEGEDSPCLRQKVCPVERMKPKRRRLNSFVLAAAGAGIGFGIGRTQNADGFYGASLNAQLCIRSYLC
jgi:hypothetical protein